MLSYNLYLTKLPMLTVTMSTVPFTSHIEKGKTYYDGYDNGNCDGNNGGRCGRFRCCSDRNVTMTDPFKNIG